MPSDFEEVCHTKECAEYMSSLATVSTRHNGHFVQVETDPYEGCAMFTLPTAKLVHAALGRAIEHARRMRKGA